MHAYACCTFVDWPSSATSRDPVSTPAASAPPPGAAALTTVRSRTFSTVIPSFWDDIVTEYSSLLLRFKGQGGGQTPGSGSGVPWRYYDSPSMGIPWENKLLGCPPRRIAEAIHSTQKTYQNGSFFPGIRDGTGVHLTSPGEERGINHMKCLE